ncbi:MAG: hypothetical protein ACFFD7_10595 [Candidatus Thorarchaeota archaeon]
MCRTVNKLGILFVRTKFVSEKEDIRFSPIFKDSDLDDGSGAGPTGIV